MKFDTENFSKNLPDVYKKDSRSNNYKLLQCEKISTDKAREDIQDVLNSLNIQQAVGKTLDLYGEIVEQKRGTATDEKYRLMILTKNMRNIANADFNSLINALSLSFNCKPSEIKIKNADDPCTVDLIMLPYDFLGTAGLTQSEILSIINELLPVCIKLNSFSFKGTFEYAEYENVYDEAKGYADIDGTIGGYYGAIGFETEYGQLGITPLGTFLLSSRGEETNG